MLICKKRKFGFKVIKKKYDGKDTNFLQKYWLHTVYVLFIPVLSWEEHIEDRVEEYYETPIVVNHKVTVPINDEHSIMSGEAERNY